MSSVPEAEALLAGRGEAHSHGGSEKMSWAEVIAAGLFFFWAVTTIAIARNRMGMAVVLASVVVPVYFVYTLIRKHLHDPAVPQGLLHVQFIYMLLAVSLFIGVVQVLTSAITFVLVFGRAITPLMKELGSGLEEVADQVGMFTIARDMTDEQQNVVLQMVEALWQHTRNEIAVWRLVIVVFALAFVTFALVEQMGTYLVARAYRELPATVGVRGVLAVACTSALGLALAQHKALVCSSVGKDEVSAARSVVFGLLGAMLEYPLHMLTGLYMGVQIARYVVFLEPVSVWDTLQVPVLAHGTVVFFILLALLEWDNAPVLIPVALVVSVVVLGVLWRFTMSAYRDIIDKENHGTSMQGLGMMYHGLGRV